MAEGFYTQTKPYGIATQELDDSFWFPLYAKIRYTEEGMPKGPAEFIIFKKKVMDIQATESIDAAFSYFAKEIIDTSKYSGSTAEIVAKLSK